MKGLRRARKLIFATTEFWDVAATVPIIVDKTLALIVNLLVARFSKPLVTSRQQNYTRSDYCYRRVVTQSDLPAFTTDGILAKDRPFRALRPRTGRRLRPTTTQTRQG